MAVCFIGGYILYYLFFESIYVVKSSVGSGATDVDTNVSITFTFNRGLDALKDVQITSSPQSSWGVEVKGKDLTISPKARLLYSTYYKVVTSGRRIKSFEISFTTKEPQFGAGDVTAENALNTYDKAFPLLKYLPYKTAKYVIMQEEKDYYFVNVYGIYSKDWEEIKQEVFAWFRSKGVDPNSVRIDFRQLY